ncbi:6188_t:CDS:2, partial [Gigaspora rosea]
IKIFPSCFNKSNVHSKPFQCEKHHYAIRIYDSMIVVKELAIKKKCHTDISFSRTYKLGIEEKAPLEAL